MTDLHPNARRVADAARELGLDIEVRTFPEGTKTAADAAAAIGVEVGQIVKSLIFAVDGEVVVAYVSGANQLDEKKLAAAAGGAQGRPGRRRRRAPGHRLPDRRACRPSATPRRCGCSSTRTCWPSTWCGRPPARGTTCSPLTPDDLVRASGGTVTDLKRYGSSMAPQCGAVPSEHRLCERSESAPRRRR